MEELLTDLYYNPKTGFNSKDKLYRRAKELDDNITGKIVKEFLDRQATAQITKQVKKQKVFNTIISPSVKNNYQMDIFVLPHPNLNQGFKYLLTCIDVYSRFAFVEKLKSKEGIKVLEVFKKMMSEEGNPKNLNVDEGSEFIYTPFRKYCEDNDITLWYSNKDQDNKNSIIERFHRTLRNYLLRYEVATGKSYIDDLDYIIDNYNNTYHVTIKNKPIDVWEEKTTPKQKIKVLDMQFEVGESVRHLNKKKVFDKNSSIANYTKKVYTISNIDNQSIYLDDLTKPFRQHELIKAIGDSLNVEYDNKIKNSSREARIKRRLKREGLD